MRKVRGKRHPRGERRWLSTPSSTRSTRGSGSGSCGRVWGSRSASPGCRRRSGISVAALGFDAVWLMGVWERSPAGVAIALQNPSLLESFGRALPGFTPDDVVGSPYCVRDYTVAKGLGGPKGLASARKALERRGLQLILDFVPNHVAPDHAWTSAHPEYFVGGSEEDARARPGLVRQGRRAGAGERPRPVLPGVARRGAAERVLAGPARRRHRHARPGRRAVRRRPLRHGDADDERHLRAHLGRARRRAARGRLLADGDRGREESLAPTSCSWPRPTGTSSTRSSSRASTTATTSACTTGSCTRARSRCAGT